LEKVMEFINNPGKVEVDRKERHTKLEKVVSLVNNIMVDPDIDIDYCIPGVEMTLDNCDTSGDPYVLVTYVVSEYTKPTRKIHLGSTALQDTPEKIADKITFFIEEFKGEIESVEMG